MTQERTGRFDGGRAGHAMFEKELWARELTADRLRALIGENRESVVCAQVARYLQHRLDEIRHAHSESARTSAFHLAVDSFEKFTRAGAIMMESEWKEVRWFRDGLADLSTHFPRGTQALRAFDAVQSEFRDMDRQSEARERYTTAVRGLSDGLIFAAGERLAKVNPHWQKVPRYIDAALEGFARLLAEGKTKRYVVRMAQEAGFGSDVVKKVEGFEGG